MSLINKIANKPINEAIDILCNAYEEKQASMVKEAMDTDTRNALIGGLTGAGLGGLGTSISDLIKGRKLSLRNALYGAMLGSVPGAATGYLAGGSIAPYVPQHLKDIVNKVIPAATAAEVKQEPPGAASGLSAAPGQAGSAGPSASTGSTTGTVKQEATPTSDDLHQRNVLIKQRLKNLEKVEQGVREAGKNALQSDAQENIKYMITLPVKETKPDGTVTFPRQEFYDIASKENPEFAKLHDHLSTTPGPSSKYHPRIHNWGYTLDDIRLMPKPLTEQELQTKNAPMLAEEKARLAQLAASKAHEKKYDEYLRENASHANEDALRSIQLDIDRQNREAADRLDKAKEEAAMTAINRLNKQQIGRGITNEDLLKMYSNFNKK